MRTAARGSWLVLAIVWLLGHGESAAREFRAADTQAEDYPTVQALLYMDRLVNERSRGRHRIRVFHSRRLGEEKETIEQTRAGAIDLNRTHVAPLGSFVPTANVLALPFLFRSTDHLRKVLDGPIGSEILASFALHGFIGLAFYDSGARSIYNSVRPIGSPADLKGLRIRVQQSDLMIEILRALGAEPVALPYGQVLTGLATRLIDGAENNWPSYVTTGHYRLARHYSLTEHVMSPEAVMMSRRAWESLAPDEQDMFRQAALESSRYMRTQWTLWEWNAREEARRSGVEVVARLDRAPFEAAVAGIYDRVLTDTGLRRLVERIREVR
jgi:tripartite ATP-independent transporter DctP family solute receptor